jgi:nitroreductase
MQPGPVFWQRYSCRSFQDKSVPPEFIDVLLEAARWAPSAGNLQPWKFHVVRNPGIRNELAQAAYGQDFLVDAPVVIVISAVAELSAGTYGERGRSLYCLQDTAAAAQNILLQATMLGLGSAWVGAFRESAVVRALALSEGEKPVAIIPVGYPAEPMPQDRTRKPLEAVVRRLD